MADYNIYIHAIGTGGSTANNPTIPWSAREGGEAVSPTSAFPSNFGADGAGAAKAIIKASAIAQNPDSILGQAVSSIAKAIPFVAAAYAVVKLGTGIVDTCYEYQTLYTGDYRNQIGWQNFKNRFANILTPVSSSINANKTETQWRIENSKRSQQRELLGDSVINSYTNKGV